MIESAEHPRWRKATRCSAQACIEVARVGDHYLIRDSKDPDADPLRFTGNEWAAFVAGVQGGDFDFA